MFFVACAIIPYMTEFSPKVHTLYWDKNFTNFNFAIAFQGMCYAPAHVWAHNGELPLLEVAHCRADPVLARILSYPDLRLLIKLDICLSLLGLFGHSLLLHTSHSSQCWLPWWQKATAWLINGPTGSSRSRGTTWKYDNSDIEVVGWRSRRKGLRISVKTVD